MDKDKDLQDRRDEATDDTTLDEIEQDENLADTDSDAPSPAPDEGGGREDDSNLDGVG